IIVQTQNSGLPTLVEYTYGRGRVLATGMTLEFLYNNNYNSAPLMGQLIEYSLDASSAGWLSTTLSTDTIPAGSSLDYDVLFDATQLLGGTYEAVLQVSS